MILMILAAAAAVSGADAPPAAKPVAPPPVAVPAKDPMVCRVDPAPKSRIPATICMRKSQADQMARDAQRNMGHMMETGPPPKGN